MLQREQKQRPRGLKLELDSVLNDRRTILVERQALNDDKAQHAANLDSLVELRAQVKNMAKTVALREAEISRLNEVVSKQEAIIRGEEGDLESDRKEILKLMQRNVQLETQIKDLEPQLKELTKERDERAKAQGRFEAQTTELTHARKHCDVLETRLEQSRDLVEKLRQQLHDEKLHVAGLELKNSEIEKL